MEQRQEAAEYRATANLIRKRPDLIPTLLEAEGIDPQILDNARNQVEENLDGVGLSGDPGAAHVAEAGSPTASLNAASSGIGQQKWKKCHLFRCNRLIII